MRPRWEPRGGGRQAMTTKLAKNRTPGVGRSIGPKMEEVPLPDGAVDPPAPNAAHAGLEPALALHMGLPGTRLDMMLGGPHPLLVELVRHLARAAAWADHAAGIAGSTVISINDTHQEDL